MVISTPSNTQQTLDSTALPTSTLYALLEPVTVRPSSSRAVYTNWGLAFRCRPVCVFEPENEEQCRMVIELARREGVTVRAAGVGHSPSDVACTGGFMIRMDKMDKIVAVDGLNKRITVQPGLTLDALHGHLVSYNLALPSIGSISAQTVGGVIVTSTHGSGLHPSYPSNMSLSVVSLSLLLSSGERITCSRKAEENPDVFLATLCGLGMTGLVVDVTLQCEERFRLKEVACNVRFEEFVERLEDIATSAEHVRCWWFGQRGVVRVSRCDRTSDASKQAASWFRNVILAYHVVQFMLFIGRYWGQVNTWTAQFASWLMKDPAEGVDESWKIFNVECRYPQHTTEFALPLATASTVLRAIRSWIEKEYADPNGLRPHFPFEIRFSEADDIWLSPAYGRRTCWVGIAQYKPYSLPVPYASLFAAFERIVLAHGGRPHWAKDHPLGPEDFKKMYPMWEKFLEVRKKVDKEGMWVNEYVERCFGVRREVEGSVTNNGDEDVKRDAVRGRGFWRFGEEF